MNVRGLIGLALTLTAGFCDQEDQLIAYYQIEDYGSALNLMNEPIELELHTHLKAELLTRLGLTQEALSYLRNKKVHLDPAIKINFLTLENLAWSLLSHQQGASEQLQIASTVGAFLTRDAKAAQLLKRQLYSSNYKLRALAANFISSYRDPFLKEALLSRLKEEKQYDVKMALISSCGHLSMKEALPYLEQIMLSSQSTQEMQTAALVACVEIYEKIQPEQLDFFLSSQRAVFKKMGLKILLSSEKCPPEMIAYLEKMVHDEHTSVVQEALVTAAYLSARTLLPEELKVAIHKLKSDSHPAIALLASFAASRIEGKLDEGYQQFLFHRDRNIRITAIKLAGSLGPQAHAGLMQLLEDEDRFIRLNAALTLMSYGQALDRASHVVDAWLASQQELVMERPLPAGELAAIVPSQVKHHPYITAYPSVADGMARLRLIHLLAIHRPEAVKRHLKALLEKKEAIFTFHSMALMMQEELEHHEELRELAEDEDPKVAMAALMALAFVGKEPGLAPRLEKLFDTVDFENKVRIIEALGHIGSHESVPFLIKMMENPFTSLQLVAASALIQVLYH